jgi:hypothetical protein
MANKKDRMQKWADALRSGDYKQTRDTLQDKKGYCCLGVACEVFIPKSKQKLKKHEGYAENKEMLCGSTPEGQENSPKWLQKINREVGEKLGSYKTRTGTTAVASLVHLNDVRKYSFDEIADIIELIYVHEAL